MWKIAVDSQNLYPHWKRQTREGFKVGGSKFLMRCVGYVSFNSDNGGYLKCTARNSGGCRYNSGIKEALGLAHGRARNGEIRN